MWEYVNWKSVLGSGSARASCSILKTSVRFLYLPSIQYFFKAEHDCRKCPNFKCRNRKIPDTEVVVHRGQEIRTILVKDKESLLRHFIRQEFIISAHCGVKEDAGNAAFRFKGKSGFLMRIKRYTQRKSWTQASVFPAVSIRQRNWKSPFPRVMNPCLRQSGKLKIQKKGVPRRIVL